MYKILFVAGAALLLASGCEDSKITTLTNENETLKAEILQLKKAGCDPCIDSSIYPPFQYMEINTLNTMSKNYRNARLMPQGPITQTGGGSQPADATAIWFDLDALKGFVWEIEKNMCGKKCSDGQQIKLGVRIYYARYPEVKAVDATGKIKYPDLQNVDASYENLHTLFMVPTYDKNGDHFDFDPRKFDAQKCVAPSIIINETLGNTLLALAGDYPAKNHGGLCPPLTNCAGAAFR